jgi:hypothetical protein
MVKTSEGLLDLTKNVALLRNWVDKGLSLKIMAPITGENFEAAKQLSDFCEARHIPEGCLQTTLVDGTYLFHFTGLQPFFIDDAKYIDKIGEMLSDFWKIARPPSTVTLESIINPPLPPFEFSESKIPHIAYTKSSIRVEENMEETVTEKDIINKIINAKRIIAKDPRKDVNSLYGSNGYAIIHPPNFFNIPDMMIGIWHCDKQSSFGAEDRMTVSLWLETPMGHLYVPVAHVTDNPEGAEWAKGVFAFTPAGENCQLVNKDQFQVRIYGNSLFAGWTIPAVSAPICSAAFKHTFRRLRQNY